MWPSGKDVAKGKAEGTLRAAGYAGSFKGLRIVANGSADKAGSAMLHAIANRTLLRAILDEPLGDCIHVTADMNALTDPFHRRLCAEVCRAGQTRFQVVCFGKSDPASGVGDLPARIVRRWENVSWHDRLAAIRLLGGHHVDLWTAPTSDVIRYMVFGGRHALFQAVHDGSDGVAGEAWLVDSWDVNAFLVDRARHTLKASARVGWQPFEAFFVRVNGTAAHEILVNLRRAGPTSREDLLSPRLRAFDPGVDEVVDGLVAVGLVAENGRGTLGITDQGRQYLA